MTGYIGAIRDTERSAGWSSRAPSTADSSVTSDADMAWLWPSAQMRDGHERHHSSNGAAGKTISRSSDERGHVSRMTLRWRYSIG